MPPPAERPLQVALDATPLSGDRTGIGEFCARVLDELAHRPDLQVGAFALSRRGRGALAGLLPEGVRALGPPGPGVPARVLHASWALWPFPPAELYAGKARVVHGTNFVVPPTRKAAMVVSVHDLSPLHFPQWCRPAARGYPALVRKAVNRGAWVHTDSQFVAHEVSEALGVPADRVRTVYLGTSPPRPAAARAVRRTPGPQAAELAAAGWAPREEVVELPGAGPARVPRDSLPLLLPDWVSAYVLAVGTIEPRKDMPTLVRAFGRFAGAYPGLALVIAGADGLGGRALTQAIDACQARQRVLRLGWVDDAGRNALIEAATVYAYPSRYEGFGLSPLQAMAVGTPVVATNAGALGEILGDAAWLVGVGDDEALANALQVLVDDAGARQDLSRKGRERAGRYSWEACAAGLAALYHEAAEAAN